MTNQIPALSVVIPWCDRPEIEITLQHNYRIFVDHNIELVIVNCGGSTEWLRELLSQKLVSELQCVELQGIEFNKSLALNIGTFAAHAAHVFFLDTDILLRENFMPEVLKLLERPCFVTIDRVFEEQRNIGFHNHLKEIAYSIELVGLRNRKVRLETNRVRFHDGSRSGPGLVFLARQDFFRVEGMNSDLKGWGWEDLDLLARLQLALGLQRHCLGAADHLTHSDELRVLTNGTRTADEEMNFAICLANYSLGHYIGTYREDIAKWKDRMVVHRLISHP
jgi:predicted glycosyltransferase involved in capsule biosynthesis